MESGEYFLKASDREAREIERRKQKVLCNYRGFYGISTHLPFSKLKRQKRDGLSVQKHSLRLLKPLHPLSKRNGVTVNGQLVISGVKKLGRLRRKRKRRKNVKIRMLKRKMNHDAWWFKFRVWFSVYCTAMMFFFCGSYFEINP